MRRLSWILTLPITVVAVLFALDNREAVTISLWPLPIEVELPLFLMALGTLVLGFLIGAIAAWFAGGATRRRARLAESEARRLAGELTDLRARQAREIARAMPPQGAEAMPPAPIIGPMA